MKRPKQFSRLEMKDRWYRRRYLVPNAVTVGNMFCGFLAIIYASNGRFEKAAYAILFAILLDGLDGRVARKLNATSPFGVEFDSFSDLVSFGVAPAFIFYQWCFNPLANEFGVVIAFFYAMCAASRLARFNVSPPNLESFVGLPSPGAAVTAAALVNFIPKAKPTWALVGVGAFAMISLGYLMVCRIEFLSIKTLKVSRMRLPAILLLGAIIALVWYKPREGLLLISVMYAASGPFALLFRRRRTVGEAANGGDVSVEPVVELESSATGK